MLVIDDEPQIRRVIRNILATPGNRILEATSGSEGIDIAAAERPSLIVLDLGLADIPGIEVCREIRKWYSAPIIILSARHSDAEKAALLDAGADDYVTKPFSTVEFQARVRAQLRRATTSHTPSEPLKLENGKIIIDVAKLSLSVNGQPVHLTRTEWDLLRIMVKYADCTLTHKQIFDAVWGSAYGDAQKYLRVHIAHLRQKIEPDPLSPRHIITEPGTGYRFVTE